MSLRSMMPAVLDYCLTSLRHHHLDKLLVIDLSITIHISLTNHLINLLIGQLLAQICHHMTKLSCADEAVSITVEDLECLDKLFFGVRVLHLACHQGQELREIDGAISISIDLIDHVLELSFGWVLTQGSHHCAQLFRRDGSITIFVEKREGLLELSNLLLGQLVGHCKTEPGRTQDDSR